MARNMRFCHFLQKRYGPTDGHSLLYRCEDATKKASNRGYNDASSRGFYKFFQFIFVRFLLLKKKQVGPTDQWTDTPSYIDARTHLKIADTLVAKITKIRIKRCINMIDTPIFLNMWETNSTGILRFSHIWPLLIVNLKTEVKSN